MNKILVLSLFSGSLLAQNPEDHIARMTEDATGLYEEETNYEEVYEHLVQKLSQPVDLNKADADELRALFLFTESQIQALIHYRETYGPIISVYELQTVPGFDTDLLRRVLPVLRARDPAEKINRELGSRLAKNDNQYLILRFNRSIEKQNGFTDQDPSRRFVGPDGKWYMRYRNNRPGDFSVGFTAENDPGERFRWRPRAHQYGFDFVSGHLQLRQKGIISNLILGDYQAQFGQGLIFGGGLGLGKGGETITTARRAGIGFSPYTSAGETGFFRGIATTVSVSPRFEVSTLYSQMRQDGAIDEHTTLQMTGLHRLPSELNGRKQITEKNLGGGFHYHRDNLAAGVVWNHTHFSHALNPRNMIYNGYAFRGRQITNGSVYLDYRIYHIAVFAELAATFRAGRAAVVGMLGSVAPALDMSLVYRSFDRDFHSLYANAFSESSRPQNERGLYWGWKYQWTRNVSIAGYTDLFRFPWLSYRRYAPASGYEWLIRLHWKRGKKIESFLQVREEQKMRNTPDETTIYQLATTTKRNLWWSVTVDANDYIRLQSRLLASTFAEDSRSSTGMVLTQDLTLNFGKLRFTARHAVLDAGNYENRMYVYERDAWMAFSLPAYYGVGVRNYLLCQWKVSRSFTVWLRYARQRFIDREETGTGSDAVKSDSRNDIKMQAMLRF